MRTAAIIVNLIDAFLGLETVANDSRRLLIFLLPVIYILYWTAFISHVKNQYFVFLFTIFFVLLNFILSKLKIFNLSRDSERSLEAFSKHHQIVVPFSLTPAFRLPFMISISNYASLQIQLKQITLGRG